MNNLLSHAATVIHVKDVEKSLTFYTEKLGFEVTYQQGDPTNYAVLNCCDSIHIHLTKRETLSEHAPDTLLYIFVKDVDLLYEAFSLKGLLFRNKIDNRDYGMRDFDIKDPDGYIITFGQNIE